MSWSKIMIVGNLRKDPELRYTPSGDPVTSFSVAVNRKWKNSDGTPGEEVTWFQVSAWGNLAETCNQYLSKGRQVFIEGRLVPDPATGGPRIWTGSDGKPYAAFSLRAISVKSLDAKQLSIPINVKVQKLG